MNLADILIVSALRCSDSIALVCGERKRSYGQLVRRVRQLAGGMHAMGVRRGGHVVLIADNSDACVECVLACAWIGAVCEQYNTRLSDYAMAQMLSSNPPQALFASERFLKMAVELGLAGEQGVPIPVVALDDKCLESAHDASLLRDAQVLAYEELLDEGAIEEAPVDLDAASPCMELFTSGTTGAPRGVVLSHGALLARLNIEQYEFGYKKDDVVLCVLPLFHVTSVAAYAALKAGAQVVVARANDGASISQAVSAHGVTRVGLVPFLMRSLVDEMQRRNISLPTLRQIIYGGEFVEPALLARCHAQLACELVQGYGMTETLAAIALLRPSDCVDDARMRSVGKAVHGMELRIFDEGGEPLPAGSLGEIAVKTPTLMLGYRGDPERTAKVIRNGWYHTGDVGYLDAEGYLFLVDRMDNMIISGGENVYPSEILHCLRECRESVADAVVVGIPDEHWGEALAAFVVGVPGAHLDPAALRDYCGERLGTYKRPREVVVVDSLKRSSSGKIPADYLDELTAPYREETHA